MEYLYALCSAHIIFCILQESQYAILDILSDICRYQLRTRRLVTHILPVYTLLHRRTCS